MLDLAGAVVTADAMHCQRETAAKIVARQADYLLIVKGNQETLQTELKQALLQAFETDCPRMRRCRQAKRNHGREETREVAVLPVPQNSAVFACWPGLATLGCIYRNRELDGRVEESTDISSRACRPKSVRLRSIYVRIDRSKTRNITCWM